MGFIKSGLANKHSRPDNRYIITFQKFFILGFKKELLCDDTIIIFNSVSPQWRCLTKYAPTFSEKFKTFSSS